MASISPEVAARELLACCETRQPWHENLIDRLVQPDAHRELFSIVVERLADLFEPELCLVYSELFSQIIARKLPLHAAHLAERYRRIRIPRRFNGPDPGAVCVLSRVTLGADVAVTSVILDAVRQRFPKAEVYLAGPQKSWELFSADPQIRHLPIAYGRLASLEDRLSIWPQLRDGLCGMVIDPDSRLTQLGLLPVCPEQDYYFFESRAYGGDSEDALPELTRRWVQETFGVAEARAFVAPVPATGQAPDITVSLGIGENPAKRMDDRFEAALVRLLASGGASVLIDRGGGGEEAERVERAVAAANSEKVQMWGGSFAGFVAEIARSRLYVGYDSAGGHVAAAAGIPLISIFGGFVSERMFQRWRPTGRGPIHIFRSAEYAQNPDGLIQKLSSHLPPGGML